jgi:hypothetical protein
MRHCSASGALRLGGRGGEGSGGQSIDCLLCLYSWHSTLICALSYSVLYYLLKTAGLSECSPHVESLHLTVASHAHPCTLSAP